VAIKGTNIGDKLAEGWVKIGNCVDNPSACSSAS